MTLKEFIFDGLENFDTIYIDYGRYIKNLTSGLYELLHDCEVENWYLDIKQDKPCIIIKVGYWGEILSIENWIGESSNGKFSPIQIWVFKLIKL